MNVTVPSTPSASGLYISRRFVEEAIRSMDVEGDFDVIVKWTSGRRRLGSCKYRLAVSRRNLRLRPTYTLTISRLLGSGAVDYAASPAEGALSHLGNAQLSECLWHELTHLAQSRRMGHSDFINDYLRYSGTSGGFRYQRNPYEVEARENAAANAHKFPLWTTERERATRGMRRPIAAPANSGDDLPVTERLRRAKNSLASTRSMLKKAQREGDATKVAKLTEKLASDEARVARLQEEAS